MKLNFFFEGVLKGQKLFGETISAIINLITFTLVYFFGVGLTSIIAKIFHQKFLETKIDKESLTYWQELNLTKKPLEEYYRQF